MNEIIRLVVLTGGLLAIMPFLLILTLAVSIERLWFLKRILRQGRDVHSRLRQVPYQNIAGLQAVADESADHRAPEAARREKTDQRSDDFTDPTHSR